MDLEKYSEAKKIEAQIEVLQRVKQNLDNFSRPVNIKDWYIELRDPKEPSYVFDRLVLSCKYCPDLILKLYDEIKDFCDKRLTELTQQFAEL